MNENKKVVELIHELKSDLSIIELNIKEAPNLKKAPYQKAWSVAVEMDTELGDLLEILLNFYRNEAKARRNTRRNMGD
ncbi:hypothetical protein CBF68_05390 [Lactobacillus taiwanensis]|uniref:hypothetical protein n=1 Tax=Lactobacillus taiwanensis TaxID=508451 RepID=UPI000B98DCF1|nr:hypothetical protein [Lactobacillus taiwanensis]OYS00291.1 hypothetical protein CBF64_03160 [Lactobacillus taiwanensis]OYS03732.1 hypothetical protein CBF68_05390 [Lactobacillus taiwanensis]